VLVREDFRRDGLAATFLADKDLMTAFINAFPSDTRINIGYPSICDEEARSCAEILAIKRTNIELGLVGHARRFDLDVMARLLDNQELVSANVWLPVSKQAAERILGCGEEIVLQRALECARYWNTVSDQPLDIALTDCTADEESIEERIARWFYLFKENGYRDVILCDTRGIGTAAALQELFKKIDSFEWHPHDDNGGALNSVLLAIECGASRIGTSVLRCSERMNMLDPRSIPDTAISHEILEDFASRFARRFGTIESIRDTVYGADTIVTGTHYRLWGRREGTRLFGVTTSKALAQQMLGSTISDGDLRVLKDELLYRAKRFFLDEREFRTAATRFLTMSNCK